MRKIIKMFEQGNVCVVGLVGSGKDMIMSNVAARRRKQYISNTNYGGSFISFQPSMLNFRNSWRNFMSGQLNHFEYPYPDGIDFYIADVGVYMPSQAQAELCKEYGYIPVSMALIRQVCGAHFHFNVQNLNRAWDKLREMSDLYIRCVSCKVLFGKIVIQRIILYELYDSCVRRVPPFRLKRPFFNADRIQQWEIQKLNYEIAHGSVTSRTLIYWNRSKYNTRIFKEMLANA